MLQKTEIPLLMAELVELDRMLAELNPRSVTARSSLTNRKRRVLDKLEVLSQEPDTAAFVQLLFTGAPVVDTRAIDASFAADAIHFYQDILTKATAVKQGSLGRRGVVAGAATDQARFYLTGIARGSFGFILEENPETTSSMFDTSLKTVVKDVTRTMESFCSLADEQYETFIQDLDKRLFSSFKSFFKLLHESRAQLKIVESGEKINFNESKISTAYRRAETTQVDEDETEVTGTLLGMTPISGTFDFLSLGQRAFSGKISPAFISDYRNQVEQGEFLQPGKKYIATLLKRTTTRGTNTPHVVYFLINLTAINDREPDEPDLDDLRDQALGR